MSYRIVGHTADVRLLVESPTLEGLLAEALAGLMELLAPQSPGKTVRRTLSVQAPDNTALLVDFLNATLSSAVANHEAYVRVTFSACGERSLRAKLTGTTVGGFGRDVKAVTYHEADVKRDTSGCWMTTLVVDV